MKKVLSWVLLLTLVLGLFAGCNNEEVPETTAPTEGNGDVVSQGDIEGITAALEYLKVMYKTTEEATPTPRDYQRLGIVRIGGVPYEVVWTTDLGEEYIQPVVNDDGTVTMKILQQPEDEGIPYQLTATITDAEGNSVTHSWNMILPKAVDMAAIVDAAYELANGEVLPYEATLTGKIISIDTVWSDDYQNITVTIVVEGKEDKPIKCYRLKGDGAKDLQVGNIITVTGTIKNYSGTIEFDAGCILEAVEKGDAVDAPTDPGEILKAAYALGENEALPYPAKLTGKVIAIDSPYDPNYGNLSVIIEVEGYSQYPILCYRLKGLGADQIAVEDIITVNGIIKNYKGTIEYDAGCQLIERISGGNIAEKPSSDPNKIIPDAYALAPGESLPYRATLTGEIYSIDTPYSAEYGNITVTIKVNGYKFQCYRMVGDGIDQIRETDRITVSGIIKNYNGKIEFDAKCTLDAWEKGPRNVNYGPVKEDVAYALYVNQETLGKTLYFNGSVSGSRLQTSAKGSEAKEIYAERISGKGVRFYYMDGETKTYIEAEEYYNSEGKLRGQARITTTPTCYWTYQSDLGVYVVGLATAGKHFLGAYGSYETITASWSGYLETSTSPQYVADFIEFSKVPTSEPTGMIPQGTPVDEPVAGTAYKFGFYQNQQDGKPFLAMNGKMAGFYFGTSNVMAEMVDVYVEAADGGYHIYILNNGTKTYLDVVPRDDDPTKVNVVFQTSGTHTVYQLNTEHKYVYTTAVGTEWYLGTYGTNSSISASKTSYISDTSTIGVSQFCAWFNNVVEVEAPEEEPEEPTTPDTPVVPDAPAGDVTMVTAPEIGKAYKMAMDKKDGKLLYFNGQPESPEKTYRLAVTENVAEAVDVYLEAADGGYHLYFMNNGVKTYIRVFHRTDDAEGRPGFGKGSLEFVTDKPSETFVYDETANTLFHVASDNDSYYMGTYGTYTTVSVSNTSYITGDKASSVDVSQFPVRFYEVSESTDPSEPPVSDDALQVVFMNPEHTDAIVALGQDKTYGYLKTTAVSSLEDLTGENVFTLEPAGDYVYIKDCYGRYLYMTGNFDSVNLSDSLPESGAEWNFVLIDQASSTFYITNVLMNKTMGFDAGYGSYGVYADAAKHTAICVAKVGDVEIDPPATEPPATEPPATEPPVEGEGFVKVTSADQFTSGQYVMIVSTGYAPGVYDNTWLSAVQPVVSGGIVTDPTGAIWTLTVDDTSVVLTDANGVSIAPKGGNNNGVSDKSYDWKWSFNNGTFRFAGTGTDTVVLASNATTTGQYPGNHRFRGYKTTTVSSQAANYPCDFTLYKLTDGADVPPTTEPPTTEPPATEPTPSEPSVSEGVEIGKTYKWAIDQENKGVTLYFAGTMSGYYGATTEDINNAVDVVLEAADGGYYVSFTDPSGAKKYINVVVSGTHKNFTIANAPASVYTYSAEHNTLLTDVEGTTCYIGTYGTYNTFSVSSIDKISTSFPSYFVGVGGSVEPEPTEPPATEPPATEPTPSEPSVSEGVEIGKTYKWAIDQENKGVTLYFAGTMNGYYGATTEDINNAVDVVLEAADGGYYVSFTDPSGAKKYINVVVSGTHKNFTIANAPASVYTYSAEHNTLLTDVEGTTCYIGTYGTYNTFSVSPIDKISTSFPSYFVGVGGSVEPEPSEPPATEPPATEPTPSEPSVSEGVEIGKTYKWAIDQENKGVTLYFAGTMNGYYGATTEDINNAVDVVLEAADGGYYVSFTDPSGAKKYINVVVSGTHKNFTIANAPASVYTYSAEHNTLLTDVEGTTCYIGTYGTYNTFSVSPIDKISTSFPSYFVGVGGSVEPEPSEPPVTEPEGEVYNVVSGKNLDIKLEHEGNLESLSFEYKMTDGTMNIALTMPSNKNVYYGYFAFDGHGNVSRYDGITVEALSDGYFRVTMDIAAMNKVSGTPDGSVDTLYVYGMWTDGNGVIRNVVLTAEEETPAAGNSVTYTFADFTKGSQYAVGEAHKLDNVVTVTTNECHFTTQLRIYQDKDYDGNAVFACANTIKDVTINAGYKVSGLEVYGSADGNSWTLITTVNVDNVNYKDYTVQMPTGTSYKYLKLDAVNAQVRIPYITFTFA